MSKLRASTFFCAFSITRVSRRFSIASPSSTPRGPTTASRGRPRRCAAGRPRARGRTGSIPGRPGGPSGRAAGCRRGGSRAARCRGCAARPPRPPRSRSAPHWSSKLREGLRVLGVVSCRRRTSRARASRDCRRARCRCRGRPCWSRSSRRPCGRPAPRSRPRARGASRSARCAGRRACRACARASPRSRSRSCRRARAGPRRGAP